ncbi:TPA: ASCH domain-containing protein, partial [Morganella morganii subsp. morganii]|nr:ASCH domain-containing protein [Morganella morganii subsp. morganii]
MKAISIRQPWAWLIVNGHKDIENRSWRTKYRGQVLVHASQGVN